MIHIGLDKKTLWMGTKHTRYLHDQIYTIGLGIVGGR